MVKPPVIPFQPLTIGTLVEGTFAAIRFNPKTLFVFSMVAMSIIGLIQVVISRVLPTGFEDPALSYQNWNTNDFPSLLDSLTPLGVSAAVGGSFLTLIVAAVASLLVSGMLVKSVAGSVVGQKLSIPQAWSQLRPQIWPLILSSLLVALIEMVIAAVGVGLAIVVIFKAVTHPAPSGFPLLLLVLLAILILFLTSVTTLIVGVRLYFVPVLVVMEDSSPVVALRHSWALTGPGFWRSTGRIIISTAVTGILSGTLTSGFSYLVMLFGGILPTSLIVSILAFFGALVTGAILPFTATFNTLMSIDERIRQENLSVALTATWLQGQQTP